MTLREAAVQLTSIAAGVREVARRLDATGGPASWAAARDLRVVAIDIEHRAGLAERVGKEYGEPDPEALPAWIADAAPGELVELYGK